MITANFITENYISVDFQVQSTKASCSSKMGNVFLASVENVVSLLLLMLSATYLSPKQAVGTGSFFMSHYGLAGCGQTEECYTTLIVESLL